MTNRKNETLITGPIQLLNEYTKVVQDIANNRLHNSYAVAPFENIEDILRAVEDDFCVLPELNGIFELKTDNIVHRETVSDHTIKVVNNIFGSAFYKYLSKHQRIIVEFAAYLHDIGKGPKEKWKNGIQPVYPDHSADAIPMLARILSEDINEISEKEIQTICLLVIYHDLMGDIIGKGRSMDELSSLCLKKTDLYMLATLAEADIRAVGAGWEYDIVEKLENLIERIEVIEN